MDKARFLYLQGMFYAGQGNKFADYKDCEEAFKSFAVWMSKPWSKFLNMEVVASDFSDFQSGYQVVEAQRHAMQLQRAAAQKELSEMMTKER